ncbi:phage portal protein [Mesorhizobium sp. YIM 152430]|uniref:phage portal protein n=1 Tax=Mesorhizobium sp. YIM 152430 TaxID=3031761 RepID=UPI0023DA9A88|nr:phage portal protein [Mesorhizobium sp. YIM 152430]MDF1600173.1 phage portal protein [Mesorhizobium sp. YIM 152430]
MKELKRLFLGETEKKSVSLNNPDAFGIFGVTPTVSGPSINAATALRVPAVHSAIVLIAGTIGSLPAKVFLKEPSGGKRTASDHAAYRLVHDEANDWTSAGELRGQLTADALLHGSGYAHVGRNFAGRAVFFTRLDPRSITIKIDDASGEPSYVQRDNAGREVSFHYRDILHIAAPLGVSPISAGKEAIGLATVLERHAAQLFGSGARPSAILSKEGRANTGSDGGASVMANIKKAFRAWQANGNADPLFLDDGWTYNPATMTSTDAQFLENRRFQIEEIARLFRVPPPMLFDLTRATWSNSEEMAQQFLTLTLRPWLDAWEWAYARVLLSAEERAEGFYVEFILDDLLSANAATRATTYAQYRAMGAMTANEVRSGLNLPAKPGADTLDNPNITPGKPVGENDNTIPAKDAA